jgi:hypothetical protein
MTRYTPARPTRLQKEFDATILRLVELRGHVTARIDGFGDDPAFVRSLAPFSLELAKALDPLFWAISEIGGVFSKEYTEMVSSLVEGNLDFSLERAANRAAEDRIEAGIVGLKAREAEINAQAIAVE